MTLVEASERVGVTLATMRRWIRSGLIPQHDGEWTAAAIGQARVVAKMRERGHTLREIRRATEEGRLAPEAMIIGSDAGTLTDWAVGVQSMQSERPLSRIAIHSSVVLYRDGDYYGRDINIAARVTAGSAGERCG